MQLLKNLKGKESKTNKLKEGDLIEITKEDSTNWNEAHKSRLEKIISDDEIYILAPMSRGYVVKLNTNKKYRIIFKSKRGVLTNLAQILEYKIEGEIALVRLKLLKSSESLQRRNSFRIEKSLNFDYVVVDMATDENLNSSIEFDKKGETIDISSGGMKFYSNDEVEPEDLIKIGLKFDDFYTNMIFKVLYKEFSNNEKFKYIYIGKIEKIDSKDQEELAKRIFELQRKLASKGCLLDND